MLVIPVVPASVSKNIVQTVLHGMEQMYPLLIDTRHVSNLLDVTSYRGANIDSEHCLVGAKIRMRLSNMELEFGNKTMRFSLDRLKDPEVARQLSRAVTTQLEISSDALTVDQQ